MWATEEQASEPGMPAPGTELSLIKLKRIVPVALALWATTDPHLRQRKSPLPPRVQSHLLHRRLYVRKKGRKKLLRRRRGEGRKDRKEGSSGERTEREGKIPFTNGLSLK